MSKKTSGIAEIVEQFLENKRIIPVSSIVPFLELPKIMRLGAVCGKMIMKIETTNCLSAIRSSEY